MHHFGSNLANTKNYWYYKNKRLGQGATANVFKGNRKRDGEACAVKVVTADGARRDPVAHLRELEVVKKLDHPKIVKLYAIEKDELTKQNVIIMELCTGGSLMSLLDNPDNAFGLTESEFIIVLKDVTEGLNYLRNKKVVHRDIKPGNIMKSLTLDNKSIYKLTDFGAARELEEIDSPFQSIYGTEEYLHPDMYKRAFFRERSERGYDQKVDLWSLGVTLYHTATGNLPFRPYGGRQNKEIMYKMTAEKKPGVISGVQSSLGGTIVWSETLPQTSLLSQELRSIITPVLAGLMECNYELMWTFEKFYEEAISVTSKVSVHVFLLHHLSHDILYVDENESIKQVKEKIRCSFNMQDRNFILYFDGCPLSDIIDPNTKMKSLHTSLEKPFVLVQIDPELKQTEYKVPHINSFPAIGDPERRKRFDRDCDIARNALNSADAVHRCFLKYKLTMDIANDTVRHVTHHCGSRLNKLQEIIKFMATDHKNTVLCTNHIQENYKHALNLGASVGDIGTVQERFGSLGDSMAGLSELLENLEKKFAMNNKAYEEIVVKYNDGSNLSNLFRGGDLLLNFDKENWCGRLEALLENMKQTAISFRESLSRYSSATSEHEELMHRFQLKKLDENISKVEHIFTNGSHEGVIAMHQTTQIWLVEYSKFVTSYNSLVKETQRLEEQLQNLKSLNDSCHSQCQDVLSDLVSILDGSRVMSGSDHSNGSFETFDIEQERRKDTFIQVLAELEESNKGLKESTNQYTDVVIKMEALLADCLK